MRCKWLFLPEKRKRKKINALGRSKKQRKKDYVCAETLKQKVSKQIFKEISLGPGALQHLSSSQLLYTMLQNLTIAVQKLTAHFEYDD